MHAYVESKMCAFVHCIIGVGETLGTDKTGGKDKQSILLTHSVNNNSQSVVQTASGDIS